MKKNLVVFLVSILLFSCSSKVEQKDLNWLNGYWEIEKVIFPDGQEKVYKINETIDYFEVNDKNEGFRVKVIPQIDGGFVSNKVKEYFKVVENDQVYFLEYKMDYANWKEELLKISEKTFEVKNENEIIYQYKRSPKVEE
ncbi:hypothetical protein ACFS5J_05910 [Flavobacterium chuncheonense]|uniref:Lipocalin-like domain-containing protein n=1 Tax=Flavobacterium chuncheonense TaxID=2026653 RepID=A0ABW5YKE6_9FLAO